MHLPLAELNFVLAYNRIFFLSPKRKTPYTTSFKLKYKGGWLFTHPFEDFDYMKTLSKDKVEPRNIQQV